MILLASTGHFELILDAQRGFWTRTWTHMIRFGNSLRLKVEQDALLLSQPGPIISGVFCHDGLVD
jgi:hypothetical protein